MKKGFTLIELMGVIIILGIIGLIVTPIIQGLIKENSETLCLDQIKVFERAAKNYVSAHPYADYSEGKELSLEDLKNEGYLDEAQLENPKGGVFTGTVKIEISTSEQYKYTYQFNEDDTRCDGTKGQNQNVQENESTENGEG
ncbi:MAG: prepilin-type N-terminal cleavage/methylation domain-containing protein [Bacilli bacterium]|nr:prepilin-type N-terminal cleavage/methylation domain-containing protein [Bacilli bacterium]